MALLLILLLIFALYGGFAISPLLFLLLALVLLGAFGGTRGYYGWWW